MTEQYFAARYPPAASGNPREVERKDPPVSSPQRGSRLATRFGPYELRSMIGAGGMGEVYRAYDVRKGRTVALKLLRRELAVDPIFRERFRRESHLAARLQEPHVIPVHDFGEIDGVLFIDMRLVAGRSLKDLLAAQVRSNPSGRPRSQPRSRPRWMPRTPTGWSTATSSRRTCCSPPKTSPTWSTSGSRTPKAIPA